MRLYEIIEENDGTATLILKRAEKSNVPCGPWTASDLLGLAEDVAAVAHTMVIREAQAVARRASRPRFDLRPYTVIERQNIIDAAQRPNGKWSHAVLRAWGAPTPPPRDWRRQLIETGRCKSGENDEPKES